MKTQNLAAAALAGALAMTSALHAEAAGGDDLTIAGKNADLFWLAWPQPGAPAETQSIIFASLVNTPLPDSPSLVRVTRLGDLYASADSHEEKTTSLPKPLDDGWHFTLVVPGFLPTFTGTVGVNDRNGDVNMGADKLLENLDTVIPLRAEVSKGRLGLMGDFLSVNLSSDLQPGGLVQQINVNFDQTIAELAVRWRLIEKPRGWLDVYAGVRYVNVYQCYKIQPDAQQIGAASTALVNAVGDRLRTALSEADLRDLIRQRLPGWLEGIGGQTGLPTAAIPQPDSGRIQDFIQGIIDAKKQELADAIKQGLQARVDAIKQALSQSIASRLESTLNQSFSRVDDWCDPFIGLRGRLNLSRSWYFSTKGDFGGLGVGSQEAWQVEAALGWQISRNLFVEAGYRGLGMNYNSNGFKYDVIEYGPQVTIGFRF